MPASFSLSRLHAALLPLDAVPGGPGWNHAELCGLLAEDAATTQAAVLVPLVQRRAGLQVLLTRRTDGLRHHAGQVSFPGGRIEQGDGGPLAAALREAAEEVGLAPRLAQPLGYLDPLATITGFRVVPVVAWVAAEFVAAADPAEVSEVFEVPLAWLMARDNLTRIDLDFHGRARHVLEYRPYPEVPTQRIWGATASILLNLRQRLEALP